jgi:membrane protein
LLKLFAGTGEALRIGFLHFMTDLMPATASDLVEKTLREISHASAKSKIPLGIIFSVWSASAGMSAVMDTLNAQYQVRERRSFVHRNAIAIGLTAACAVLLLTSLALILAGGPVAEAFSHGIFTAIFKIAAWLAAFALMLLGFALIYYLAPNVKDQKWYWITPGAVCALFLWLIVSLALKVYVHFFNTYSATYGSLGAVIILLLWFYLTGTAVLLGAEINSVLEDAAAQHGDPEAKHKGEKAPGHFDPAPLKDRARAQSA